MAEHDARRPSVEAYLGQLASEEPTPGGGSAAALAGAAGAALVEMLARLTAVDPAYEVHRKLMEAITDQAREARSRLLDLAEKDAAAFDAVRAAYRLPKGTDEEKEGRAQAVREALHGAIEVPLEVMERCVEVIGLAKNTVESGKRNAASDGAVGAELARAGMRGAASTVLANLAVLDDRDHAQVVRTRLDEMLYMGTKVCTALDSYVNDLWKK